MGTGTPTISVGPPAKAERAVTLHPLLDSWLDCYAPDMGVAGRLMLALNITCLLTTDRVKRLERPGARG